jgi:cobalamin 5'-phosphate synthase/cobalamin synthase
LSTIPIPLRRQFSFEEIGRSSVYFPLVGLLLGLVLASFCWLLKFLLPPPVVNVLIITALVAFTGARHLDGLAHTADALVSHKTSQARLEIMSDKRVGSFGIIAVAGLLLVKYIALDSLPQSLLLSTLIYLPVLSRWTMVYAIFSFGSARLSGTDGDFKRGTRWYGLLVATLTALVITFFLAGLPGLVVMVGVLAAVALFATYLKGRFGGLTVATYGAVIEFVEVVTLVLVLLLVHLGLA